MTVNSPHRQIPESFASPRLQIRKRKHSRVELILLSPAYTAVSNATTGVFRRVPQCTYVVSQVFLMWCPLGCCGGGVGRPKWVNSHDRNGLKYSELVQIQHRFTRYSSNNGNRSYFDTVTLLHNSTSNVFDRKIFTISGHSGINNWQCSLASAQT